MQDNIIFYGIAEIDLQPGEYESTENTLHPFIINDMTNKPHINFIGRLTRNMVKPKPIIAKLTNEKYRDVVRFSAEDALKCTDFVIREQFPK